MSEKTDSTSSVLNILRSPVRRGAILALEQGEAGFSQLMAACGLDPNFDAGLFCYHLSELLSNQVVQKTNKGYELTRFGIMLSRMIRIIEKECAGLFEEDKGGLEVSESAVSERQDLFERAEQLYALGRYAEAIKVYGLVYEKYPKWRHAETALMMIGVCYGRMGKNDKAVEALEKAVGEYPDLRGFSESTYFYLGVAYAKANRKEEALGAFLKALELSEGVRDPNGFPCAEARDWITRLKAKQQYIG